MPPTVLPLSNRVYTVANASSGALLDVSLSDRKTGTLYLTLPNLSKRLIDIVTFSDHKLRQRREESTGGVAIL
jgi:hypothetical protein